MQTRYECRSGNITPVLFTCPAEASDVIQCTLPALVVLLKFQLDLASQLVSGLPDAGDAYRHPRALHTATEHTPTWQTQLHSTEMCAGTTLGNN